MSRKRPCRPVTCWAEWIQLADLRQCSFGCFTLIPLDAAGSPRTLPAPMVAMGRRSASEQIVCFDCQVCLGRGGLECHRSEGEVRGACEAVLPGLTTGDREGFAEAASDD